MKTKLFLAAVAVAFSFAVTSCGNKKAANTEVEATEVEVVEEVVIPRPESLKYLTR